MCYLPHRNVLWHLPSRLLLLYPRLHSHVFVLVRHRSFLAQSFFLVQAVLAALSVSVLAPLSVSILAPLSVSFLAPLSVSLLAVIIGSVPFDAFNSLTASPYFS